MSEFFNHIKWTPEEIRKMKACAPHQDFLNSLFLKKFKNKVFLLTTPELVKHLTGAFEEGVKNLLVVERELNWEKGAKDAAKQKTKRG